MFSQLRLEVDVHLEFITLSLYAQASWAECDAAQDDLLRLMRLQVRG